MKAAEPLSSRLYLSVNQISNLRRPCVLQYNSSLTDSLGGKIKELDGEFVSFQAQFQSQKIEEYSQQARFIELQNDISNPEVICLDNFTSVKI